MLTKNKKTVLIFLLTLSLGGFLFLPFTVQADTSTEDIQNDINATEKKLKKAEDKKQALESALANINASLSATQRAILTAQLKIQNAELSIERKEGEIELLQEQTEQEKFILSGLMQELYEEKTIALPHILFTSNKFSDYLNQPENLLTVQEKIATLLDTLENTKSQTEDERANLEDLKSDHQKLLQGKLVQKQVLAADQQDTVSDIEDQQTIIKRLNKELDELQGDLSKLTGQSYNAKDIKDAVSFASKETDVPKGFLMGVLKMETNLGANVGGCTYAQVESGAQANYKKGKLSKTSWNTFQYRRTLFKKITDALNLDYKKQKVSCNPSGYRGTGGAMGVAQFMPDTWTGYQSGVIARTGHNPPSPWNLTDGVMAMALKLDKTPGVDSGSRSAWKRAAAAYLGTSYAPYINGILYWADHYKELL